MRREPSGFNFVTKAETLCMAPLVVGNVKWSA